MGQHRNSPAGRHWSFGWLLRRGHWVTRTSRLHTGDHLQIPGTLESLSSSRDGRALENSSTRESPTCDLRLPSSWSWSFSGRRTSTCVSSSFRSPHPGRLKARPQRRNSDYARCVLKTLLGDSMPPGTWRAPRRGKRLHLVVPALVLERFALSRPVGLQCILHALDQAGQLLSVLLSDDGLLDVAGRVSSLCRTPKLTGR